MKRRNFLAGLAALPFLSKMPVSDHQAILDELTHKSENGEVKVYETRTGGASA